MFRIGRLNNSERDVVVALNMREQCGKSTYLYLPQQLIKYCFYRNCVNECVVAVGLFRKNDCGVCLVGGRGVGLVENESRSCLKQNCGKRNVKDFFGVEKKGRD